jgi:hypothetical protein
MQHIVEYKQYSELSEEKLNNIVEDILNQVGGGEEFFDRIDGAIQDPKNLDITLSLFNKIYEKHNPYKDDFNIVVSGSYGRKILELVKQRKIKCGGTFILMNGSITSHQNKMGLITKNKEVKIEFQDNHIGNGKEFIFVDDSYYSGTTYKLIKRFLEDRGSTIKEVYVIYDGNDKPEDNRFSLYSYYNRHSGREWDKQTLLNRLEKIEGSNIEYIKPLIMNGEIKTNRDLISAINFYWRKSGVDKRLDSRNFNFAHQI